MIDRKNLNKIFLSLFLFIYLYQLQESSLKIIETWCFGFCGNQNTNISFLTIFILISSIAIFIFIKYLSKSEFIWLLLAPLIFPILRQRNENRTWISLFAI